MSSYLKTLNNQGLTYIEVGGGEGGGCEKSVEVNRIVACLLSVEC